VHTSLKAVLEGAEATAAGENLGFDDDVFERLAGCVDSSVR